MRSRLLLAGLAAAFLPGTCSPIEGLSGSAQQGSPFGIVAPLDGGFTVKGLPLLLQATDEPLAEPVDIPPGNEDST